MSSESRNVQVKPRRVSHCLVRSFARSLHIDRGSFLPGQALQPPPPLQTSMPTRPSALSIQSAHSHTSTCECIHFRSHRTCDFPFLRDTDKAATFPEEKSQQCPQMHRSTTYRQDQMPLPREQLIPLKPQPSLKKVKTLPVRYHPILK